MNMNKFPFDYANLHFIECEDGLQLSRLPKQINACIEHTTAYQHHATMLAFKAKSKVVFQFKIENKWEIAKAIVQYGSWYECREIDLASCNGRVEINPFIFDGFQEEHVVRLYMSGESIVLQSIEGEFEPYKDERKSILFYGTSITQGVGGIFVPSTYANLVSQAIDYKMYNYGLAGNALLEQEVINHFLQERKYDAIVYECSVNLLLRGCSAKEFYNKIKYLLEQTNILQPQARIMMTSILPFYEDLGYHNSNDEMISDASTFREIVKELCSRYHKVMYMEPTELMSSNNLSNDLIHPSDEGMREIAKNIIRKIKGE